MTGETLRQHLLAIRDRHWPLNPKNPWCPTCGHPGEYPFPCPDYSDAVAALAIIAAAELISEYRGGDATEKSHWRYIPDPLPIDATAREPAGGHVSTLREHLEAMMEARSVPGDAGSAFEVIEEHGIAALAILDAAARVTHGPMAGSPASYRLVPDPDQT